MNKLPLAKRAHILHCLVEGMSLRATSRIADVSINTVTKLMVDAGTACATYQDEHFRNLPCRRIQIDEIWSFVYAKQKNTTPEMREEIGTVGDVWTWTAIDIETKLVPSWLVGARDAECATLFVGELAGRLAHRVRLTSDGRNLYLEAEDDAPGMKGMAGVDIDQAMLARLYGPVSGEEPDLIPSVTMEEPTNAREQSPRERSSRSYVKRQNLTMRMQMRRFTRLTNAFSKKVENHAHAVALHFMHYNFARIHTTLRVTPAMEAGVTTRLWSMEDIARLVP